MWTDSESLHMPRIADTNSLNKNLLHEQDSWHRDRPLQKAGRLCGPFVFREETEGISALGIWAKWPHSKTCFSSDKVHFSISNHHVLVNIRATLESIKWKTKYLVSFLLTEKWSGLLIHVNFLFHDSNTIVRKLFSSLQSHKIDSSCWCYVMNIP